MTHTIESLKDKTPEELNAQLAELCGWIRTVLPEPMPGSTNPEKGIVFCKWEHPIHKPVDEEPGHDPWHGELTVPAYATSYDAIMPCVKALTDKQTFAFIEHLRVIRNIQATGDFAFTWLMMTSSEADLTRALILVLQNK